MAVCVCMDTFLDLQPTVTKSLKADIYLIFRCGVNVPKTLTEMGSTAGVLRAGVHVCVCVCVCGYACVYVLLLLRDRISFKLMFVTVPFIKTWLLLKPDHRIL